VNHSPDNPFGCMVIWGPIESSQSADGRLHVCNRPDSHPDNHECKCGDKLLTAEQALEEIGKWMKVLAPGYSISNDDLRRWFDGIIAKTAPLAAEDAYHDAQVNLHDAQAEDIG
jgi:hypothetical protein